MEKMHPDVGVYMVNTNRNSYRMSDRIETVLALIFNTWTSSYDCGHKICASYRVEYIVCSC